jgi:hypothetical protein
MENGEGIRRSSRDGGNIVAVSLAMTKGLRATRELKMINGKWKMNGMRVNRGLRRMAADFRG